MKAHEYRDLIAAYVHTNFALKGLTVYTEVSFGKTIIGKNRKVDILVVRSSDQRALAIECKWQGVGGTTDEKIWYALKDLREMWVPGCLAYAGDGWAPGVQHTLEGSRGAVYCLPQEPSLEPTKDTLELDHVLAAVFGFWDFVVSEDRLFVKPPQLQLAGLRKAQPKATSSNKIASGGNASED
jgi:hypothetical protein